jgi:hypothetical protein
MRMLNLSDTHHFRKTVAGACMVVAPLFLLVGAILHPEDAERWSLAHVVLLVSVMLALPAVLGLMHMLRERMASYGHAGGALALIGLMATMGVLAIELVVGQMTAAGADRAEMVALLERVNETAWVVYAVAILSLLFAVGMVAIAVGLHRARAVEPWMAACIALGSVGIVLAAPLGSVTVAIVAAALSVVGLGSTGLMVLRETDADWEHTPEYRGMRPAIGTR